jgi:hypothetical protein
MKFDRHFDHATILTLRRALDDVFLDQRFIRARASVLALQIAEH